MSIDVWRSLSRQQQDLLMTLEAGPREHALHVLREFPSLIVTSARRSVERNRAIGGVPGSLHISGRAVDFAGSPGILRDAAAYCVRGGAPGSPGGPAECFIEGTGGQAVGGRSTGPHLHVAW